MSLEVIKAQQHHADQYWQTLTSFAGSELSSATSLRPAMQPFLAVDEIVEMHGSLCGPGTMRWRYRVPAASLYGIPGLGISPALLVESGHSLLSLLAHCGYDLAFPGAKRFRAIENELRLQPITLQAGDLYEASSQIERVLKTREAYILYITTKGTLNGADCLLNRWQGALLPQDADWSGYSFPTADLQSGLPQLTDLRQLSPSNWEAALNLQPCAWVLGCHFPGDPVYPGSLVIAALYQALALTQGAQNISHLQPGAGPVRISFRSELRPGRDLLSLRLSVTSSTTELSADASVFHGEQLIAHCTGLSLQFHL